MNNYQFWTWQFIDTSIGVTKQLRILFSVCSVLYREHLNGPILVKSPPKRVELLHSAIYANLCFYSVRIKGIKLKSIGQRWWLKGRGFESSYKFPLRCQYVGVCESKKRIDKVVAVKIVVLLYIWTLKLLSYVKRPHTHAP